MKPDTLPTSGPILGFLIDAFGGTEDLPPPIQRMLAARTTRRYFAGGPRPARWCCRFNALRMLLIDGAALALPPIELKGEDHAEAMFVVAASTELLLWDALERSIVRRRAYLRYVCANAIARLFAFLLDVDLGSPLPAQAPAWAERSRRGELVRRLLDAVERGRKNEEHAKKLGWPASKLSSWKTGKARPSPAAIDDLVAYATKSGTEAAATRRMLQWHYALSEIAEAIRGAEGDEFVTECARVVTQTASCLSRGLFSAPGSKDNARAHLLSFSLWKQPAVLRDLIIDDSVRHGAPATWAADVQSVCAEYEAIVNSDEVIRRALPKHKHPAWRLPRKLANRYGASLALAAVRKERGKRD